MLMNPRRLGGFDMDAVEESWISTIGVTTQVATCCLSRGVSCSADLSRVDSADPVPETAVLDECDHDGADRPAAGHFALQPQQHGDAVRCHVFRLRCDGVYSLHRVQVGKEVPSRASLSIALISNSTYKEFRATALGLGQMIGGLFRFLVLHRLLMNRRDPSSCQHSFRGAQTLTDSL